MIRVWFAPVPDVPPPEALRQWVSEARHTPVSTTSGWAYALLKQAWQSDFGSQAWPPLRFGPLGNPYLESGPQVSMAHTGSYVVCALSSDGPVGIDTEYMRPRAVSMPDAFFSESEQRWVNQELSRFYHLWTQKEAVSKAEQRGFSMDFSTINPTNGTVRLPHRTWYVHAVDSPQGYCTHVATQRATPEWTIQHLDLLHLHQRL